MSSTPILDVIIPAFNEEESISKVILDIPKQVRHIVVADNGSTDRTAQVAIAAGAQVVFEPQKGYGKACLTAMDWIKSQEILPHIVIFLDGDYSDYPQEMMNLINPIMEGKAEFVLGSRTMGIRERIYDSSPSVWKLASHHPNESHVPSKIFGFRSISRHPMEEVVSIGDGGSKLWVDHRDADQSASCWIEVPRSTGKLPEENREFQGKWYGQGSFGSRL